MANLICRFYEPTEGKILVDGRDYRERSQLWLHSALGYVLQTPHLFSGTIRDNLIYGNENATEEEIMQAIKMVSAEGIIEKLDAGLDTDVGEGGDLLSTGEKQLISFARAILAALISRCATDLFVLFPIRLTKTRITIWAQSTTDIEKREAIYEKQFSSTDGSGDLCTSCFGRLRR